MCHVLATQIDWGKVAEIAATSITTLGAAYFGAKFAFKLQIAREKSKRIKTDVDNANIAMFTVRRYRQLLNDMLSSTKENGEPFPHHHLLMKPFSTLTLDPPHFSYDSLAFLLSSNEKILFDLSSLQNQISFTLDVAKQRSEMHYNFVQPAIEQLQTTLHLTDIPDNFDEILKEKLGPRLDAVMENLTTQMLEGFSQGIEKCTEIANELAKAVEQSYPDKVKRRLWKL